MIVQRLEEALLERGLPLPEGRADESAAPDTVGDDGGAPLREIGLGVRVLKSLEQAGLVTVEDVMERLAEGDEELLKLDGIGPKSLIEIKQCIESLSSGPGEEE